MFLIVARAGDNSMALYASEYSVVLYPRDMRAELSSEIEVQK